MRRVVRRMVRRSASQARLRMVLLDMVVCPFLIDESVGATRSGRSFSRRHLAQSVCVGGEGHCGHTSRVRQPTRGCATTPPKRGTSSHHGSTDPVFPGNLSRRCAERLNAHHGPVR